MQTPPTAPHYPALPGEIHQAWQGYCGMQAQAATAAAAASPGPSPDVQSGEWKCVCGGKVLAKHLACVDCGRNRQGLPAPPEVVPWRCRFDGWVNCAGREMCSFRGDPNRPVGAGRESCHKERKEAALVTGHPFRAWDWICDFCEHHHHVLRDNFAKRLECRWCNTKRDYMEALGRRCKMVQDYPANQIYA